MMVAALTWAGDCSSGHARFDSICGFMVSLSRMNRGKNEYEDS